MLLEGAKRFEPGALKAPDGPIAGAFCLNGLLRCAAQAFGGKRISTQSRGTTGKDGARTQGFGVGRRGLGHPVGARRKNSKATILQVVGERLSISMPIEKM